MRFAEVVGDFRTYHPFPGGDVTQCGYEFCVRCVLDERAKGAGIEGSPHLVRFAEGRQHEDFRRRILAEDLGCRRGTVLLGHHQVHQDDVRFQLAREADGETYTWSGAVNDWNWAEPGNYAGGSGNLPADGDEVELPAGTQVYVTNAASYAVVRNLKRIRPLAKDVVANFFVGEDASETVNCAFNYFGKDSIAMHRRYGTLRKIGKGTLALDSLNSDYVKSGQRDYYACLLAEEGTLVLMPSKPTSNVNARYGSLVVSNAATVVLSPGGDATFCGLYGDGTITNGTASASLNATDTAQTPTETQEFSGRICGDIRWYSSARILLTGTNNVMRSSNGFSVSENNGSGESGPGVTGLLKLGNLGEASSAGVTEGGLVTRGGGGGFLYLGKGESSDLSLTVWECIAGPSFFDAGATGGLKLSGNLNTSAGTSVQDLFVLTGDNAVPVEWNGTVHYRAGNCSFHITKRGTGAWWLRSAASHMHGVFAVENGTLMFDSIAPAGTDCSLGCADVLREPICGVPAELPAVPYAFTLGTATTEGALEYKGAADAVCSTRPISLFGKGRLVNSTTNGFDFAGVSSKTDVEGTLTLDGAAGSGANVLRELTDGDGTTSLVKEGSGTWTLADTNGSFSGSVVVKEGTLRVGVPAYAWYRWSIRAAGGGTTVQVWNFGLYDSENDSQSGGLVRVSSLDDLRPGTCLEYSDSGFSSAQSATHVDNLFADSIKRWWGWGSTAVDVNDESTWLHAYMHLPEGANPVVSYDFINSRFSGRNLTAYTLYGSTDGVNWDELDKVDSVGGSNQYWYFNGGAMPSGTAEEVAAALAHHECGKTIKAYPAELIRPFAKASGVQVAAGATLEATGCGAELSSLVVDTAGMGTIRNFTLPENGTIEILSETKPGGDLPGTYENVTGLENVGNWTVKINGTVKPGATVEYVNGKLRLYLPGSVLIVR